jgi:hypothetical protein
MLCPIESKRQRKELWLIVSVQSRAALYLSSSDSRVSGQAWPFFFLNFTMEVLARILNPWFFPSLGGISEMLFCFQGSLLP